MPPRAIASQVPSASWSAGRFRGSGSSPGAAQRPGALVVAEQELQHHRRRELGRAAEPAEGRVVVPAQPLQRDVGGLPEHGAGLVVLAAQGGRGRGGVLGQRGGHVPGPVGHVVTLVPPGLGDVQHQLPEVIPRVVRAAEERLLVRGHEHRHRPAALAGHGLGGGHVDRVHVGPFLPVHLDRDHVLVEHRGRLGVLERLVRHHVAPVAGGVADREHDGDVAPGGLGEGLVAPRPPVHRVVRVLEQVRAGRILEPVHRIHTTDAETGPQTWDAVKLSNSAAAVEGESEIDSTYRPM